ncbi:MAG: metallopeptidase family protein [Thermodesulfovibrionales bacterium]
MAYRTSRKHFEELLEKALGAIPQEHKQYLANIMIAIEDYPDKEEAGEGAGKEDLLLGLYDGVPLPYKGGFFDIPNPLPDTITLFQRNIEEICATEKELVEEIRKTLVHEVGHYFGMSESDLQEYE